MCDIPWIGFNKLLIYEKCDRSWFELVGIGGSSFLQNGWFYEKTIKESKKG